ncbi:hypothetical protein SEA_JUJU_60 [Gordonia phage JuJu]|uniref:Uncharacterized protein n=1 Tax=Gordonia phage JuJu TaxID=2590929 RepID=A0A516KR52_9CAUD|nr:hypothetical protein KNU69_gp60 [Gordonia phage JuJu]QDP44176.1 hypothetical protein SEA_JUJU_60 [Gordonia phage JuJu]
MNATATEQPTVDTYRDPTEFEKAVLNGLQRRHFQFQWGFGGEGSIPQVYMGYTDDQVIVWADGTEEFIPDPRIARTERRRARNRAGRKSRRINRIRARR